MWQCASRRRRPFGRGYAAFFPPEHDALLAAAFHQGLLVDKDAAQPQTAAHQEILACDADIGLAFACRDGCLQRGGIQAEVSGCIQKDIWFKLWGNLTMNPISALTGATTDRILDDDLVRGFVSAVMLEAKAIGSQLGLPIEQQPEDRHALTRKLGAFKTSMLQDVEANKPLEIDALVGAVRELGQITSTPTPHTDALLGLVRLMARTRGLY